MSQFHAPDPELAVFVISAIFCVLSALAASNRQPARYPVDVNIIR